MRINDRGDYREISGISRRRVFVGYRVWLAALVTAYYLLPGVRFATWGLLSLSGVAAVLAGVAVNRPARRLPWLLLAAAMASFAAGQVTFLALGELTDTVLPFPSFADGLYLLTYPFYAAGLLVFIRWRTPDGDQRSLIDALTLTAGLALLSWNYLILPYVHNPGLTWLQKSAAIAYPLGDVLVLAMLARLLAPGKARDRCVQLLTLGVVAGLAADVSYGAIQLYGSFHNGTIVDLGWAVFYGAWGAAALNPTMTELTQPAPRQQVEVSSARLTVLLLASLIAPVVLFIRSFSQRDIGAGVIAVFSAILYLLVVSRLWDVAVSHRRALGRERVIREASMSLVAAVTVEQTAAAVRSAADALLGTRPRGDALLAVRTERDGALRVVPADPAGPGAPSPLAELAGTWLPLATGPAPLLEPVSRLPERARAALPNEQWLLLCPLMVEDRPSGDPFIGVLAVLGEQRVLGYLVATMETIAHQVALAIERILLRQEVTRRDNEAYFRTLVQDASDAIVIVDDDGTIRYATPSATTIFGDVTVAGARLWDLVAAAGRADIEATLAQLRADAGIRSVSRRITRLDGVRVQVEIRCSDLRADPTVGGLVLTLRDVTEQRQLEEDLKHQAFHDALTGLPNRLLFQDRISQQLAVGRRDGTIVGVLFVDLDDFKIVNDTMGHSVGDELLVSVAGRLSDLVRGADTAARLGGDEFAVLIGNVADSAAVEAAAERVVRAFDRPFSLGTGSVVTTVTVGVATTEDSEDTDELLRHADLALYTAKAAGKRQWRCYQPVLSVGMVRRRELQAALEEAVARSEFTLAYQPIVSLTSGEIVGFEALVRWPHEQWGMMQPSQFIAVAEETGQIVPLGSWVLAQAAADAARWRDGRGRGRLYVSVNVSARQFTAPGFVDSVREVLDASGLEPGALMLELTESVLLHRDESVQADLAELKSIGVRLAIDDFGTGYSSLSYLRELPVDVLKMDKSFVDGIAASAQRLALAAGIIQIARTLRLEVIAEGIESEPQRDLLISMDCRYGQGYLLAMPMPPSQAAALARTGFHLVPTLPRQDATSEPLP